MGEGESHFFHTCQPWYCLAAPDITQVSVVRKRALGKPSMLVSIFLCYNPEKGERSPSQTPATANAGNRYWNSANSCSERQRQQNVSTSYDSRKPLGRRAVVQPDPKGTARRTANTPSWGGRGGRAASLFLSGLRTIPGVGT